MVRTTRRYDVNAGTPLSVTARITCATPALFGITVATAALPFVTVTRGVGTGRPPRGADGIPAAGPVFDPRPAGAGPPPAAPGPPARPPLVFGKPVPASE